MSKTIIALFFLSGLIALCSGGVVCSADFCESVQCHHNVTEESCKLESSSYYPNGTVCGCCPICVGPSKIVVNPKERIPWTNCPYLSMLNRIADLMGYEA